jgi:hypothetical protein
MYAGTYVYNRVYTGETLASLQGVSSGGSLAPASFETLSNMTCQIMLAGDYGGEERDGAHLQFTPTVTNDLFSTRAEIEGTNLTLIAHNLGATTEAGEPPLAPGASGRTLWYSWTAPADGMLYLRVATSSVLPHGTTMLDVFQGDSPATLEPVSNGSGFGGDHIYFHVVSNETYQIRFDAGGPTWDAIPVQLDFIAAPPNDQFINATILSGLDLSSNGTIRGASPETNDPRVWLGAGNSVWYSWTAPQSGSVIVAVADAADFYALQAFTGPDLAHLTVAGVRHQADSVLLNAQAGTNYYFAVAGVQMWEPDEPGKGPFRLLLTPGTTPANDNFSNAGMLAGTSDSIVATNWVATLEADDPPIVQWFHLQRTLWYQWHAPGAGLLLLTNSGSTVNPIVGVYLGTNLSQLSMIGDRETPVRSNETVHILLDGDYGAGGVLRIGLEFLPAPANDDFAQAFSITGTSCVLTGYVRTATGESTNPGDRFRYDYRDIWWKWTAPGTGQVVITNVQPDSSTSVRVYAAGTNGPQLIGALQFDAVEGASYWVQATWGAAAGSDHVNLLLTESIGAMPSASQMTAAKLTAPIPLRLDLPRLLPDGRFAFHIQGPAGTPFQLEHSSDLAHWQILQTGVLTNDDQEVIDTEAGQAQMRFYRVR